MTNKKPTSTKRYRQKTPFFPYNFIKHFFHHLLIPVTFFPYAIVYFKLLFKSKMKKKTTKNQKQIEKRVVCFIECRHLCVICTFTFFLYHLLVLFHFSLFAFIFIDIPFHTTPLME